MKNSFRIEIKAISETGTFDGLLSVYNVEDAGKDIVEPGAFTKTILENGGEVPMLWQHKSDVPIGKLQLIDSESALAVKGTLLMELPEAQKAYALIKAGIVKGLSIGYEVVKKSMDGAVRKLKELKLFEGSIVTFPMNGMALITAVKNQKRESKDDFNEEWAEAQLYSAASQMQYALGDALRSFLYGSNMTREERMNGSETSIQQFADAYMAFLPQFLDMMDEEIAEYSGRGYMSRRAAMSQKVGRRTSAADRTKIETAIQTLQALLAEEAGSSTSDAEAAPKSEPVPDHSAAQSLIEEIRSLIPAAA